MRRGDKQLELGVLLFELAQAAQFGWPQTPIFLLPVVKRDIADAKLAAHLFNECAEFDLL